jgi:aubergine-like protein
MQKKIQVYTNYFRVEVNRDIYKYDLVMNEGDPVKHKAIVTQVLFKVKENRDLLRSNFGDNYLFLNNSFYSLQMVSEPLKFQGPNGVEIIVQHDSNQGLREESKNNIVGRLIKLL